MLYIKTVITGMRSFIALRRQKCRGPRANRKLGVLSVYWNSQIRGPFAPLALLSLSSGFPVLSCDFLLHRASLRMAPPRSQVSRECFTRAWTISGVSLLSCSSSGSPSLRPSFPARLRCTLSLIAGIYQTSK